MFYLGRHHSERVEMSRHYGRHYSTVGPYACFPPGTCRSGRRIQMAFTMRIFGSRRVEKQIYKLKTGLNVCLKQKTKQITVYANGVLLDSTQTHALSLPS